MQVNFRSHFLGKKVCLIVREIRYIGHDPKHERFWFVQIKLNTNTLTTHTYCDTSTVNAYAEDETDKLK